jgi:hypothetical protein
MLCLRARGWSALAGLVAGGAISLAAAPAVARVTSNFVLDPPSDSEATEGEVAFGIWKASSVILSRPAHAERTAKLNDAASIDAGRDMMGIALTASLKVGDVLTGSEAQPGLYCIPVPRGAVCLEDADGDGRFERARMAQCDFGGGLKYDVIAWNVNGHLCAFRFVGQDENLATPLGYVRMDPAQGPSVWANLTINKPGGGKGNKPLTFELSWELGEKGGLGKQMSGDPWYASYALPPNGVGKIDLHGMVVEFRGFAASGKLRYRVLTPMPSLTLHAWGLLARGY